MTRKRLLIAICAFILNRYLPHICLAAIFATGLSSVAIWSVAAQSVTGIATTTRVQPSSGAAITSNSWIDQKWTGDDVPYTNARRSIDRLFKIAPDHAWVASHHQRLAAVNHENPLDQFKWAYSTYLEYGVDNWGATGYSGYQEGLYGTFQDTNIIGVWTYTAGTGTTKR